MLLSYLFTEPYFPFQCFLAVIQKIGIFFGKCYFLAMLGLIQYVSAHFTLLNSGKAIPDFCLDLTG